ncbi:MAG: hypothetical protein IT305_27745 [Chloroflexi bacterium]|nr:hypothetical protein [Chloroflexota bacterium]
MESTERIAESELTPRLKAAVSAAEQGNIVPIEYEGREAAAIVDLTDHRLLRAYARALAEPVSPEPDKWLRDEDVQDVSADDRYYLALAHYLAGSMTSARLADLLQIPWGEMRVRCHRLGIPLRVGPSTIEEARAEVEAALAWDASRR